MGVEGRTATYDTPLASATATSLLAGPISVLHTPPPYKSSAQRLSASLNSACSPGESNRGRQEPCSTPFGVTEFGVYIMSMLISRPAVVLNSVPSDQRMRLLQGCGEAGFR